MKRLDFLKDAVLYDRTREGKELQVTFDKIAVEKFDKVKEDHTHTRTGKNTTGKGSALEGAAIKMLFRKVYVLETHSSGNKVFNDFLFLNRVHNSHDFRVRVSRMSYTEFGTTQGYATAACGTGVYSKHWL